MAYALDQAIRPASSIAVSEWVKSMAGPSLIQKAALVAQAESGTDPRGIVEAARSEGRLPQLEGAYSNSSSVRSFSRPGTPGPSAATVQTVTELPAPTHNKPSRAGTYVGIVIGVSVAAMALVFLFAVPLSHRPAAASPADTAPSAAVPGASTPSAVAAPPSTGTAAPEGTHDASLAGTASRPPVTSAAPPPAGSARPGAPAGNAATRPPPVKAKPGSSGGINELLDTR